MRGHFALLRIPAGQQILVEGDTICEILWSPIIIQQTGTFHMGYKATYRNQRRGAQRPLQGAQAPVPAPVPPSEWGVAFLPQAASTDGARVLKSLRVPIKGIDGGSREVFRCSFLFMRLSMGTGMAQNYLLV